MSGKMKNKEMKNISKLVKICSLIISRYCFFMEISFQVIEIFKGRFSHVLIIPKLLHRPVLTIANAS